MKYLPLIWAALTRHKTRTVLTVLTVAAAFVLFGLIGLVNHAMTHAADSVASAHRLITFAQPSRSSGLPVSLEAQIRGVPGVQAVTFNHPFWGVYQNPNNLVGGFAIPKTISICFRNITVLRQVGGSSMTPGRARWWARNSQQNIIGRSASRSRSRRPDMFEGTDRILGHSMSCA